MKISDIIYEARSKLIENNLIDEELDISLIKTARFVSDYFKDIDIADITENGCLNELDISYSIINIIEFLFEQLDKGDAAMVIEKMSRNFNKG